MATDNNGYPESLGSRITMKFLLLRRHRPSYLDDLLWVNCLCGVPCVVFV